MRGGSSRPASSRSSVRARPLGRRAFRQGARSRPAGGGILYPIAVVVLVVLGALGFGATLPTAHVASRSKRVSARPEIVWGLINDPVASKGWGGNTKTEVVERDAPRLLVTKI